MNWIKNAINAKSAAIFVLGVLIAAAALASLGTLSMSREEITDPEPVTIPFRESYESETGGDYAAAINAILDIYKEYPDDYTLNLRMGWLHYMNGDSEQSLNFYRAAIQAEPDAIEARLGYMLPLLTLEKYGDVEAAAHQVLKMDGNNYYATLRLVVALRMQGKYDLADEAAREMLALYPTDVSFLAELAAVESGRGNTETAKAISWKIRMLDPDNATADYFLGE